MNKQLGFTLLEVMVALTILAVVAIAASNAGRSYVNSVGNMKTRTLANFVAQNTLAELKIKQQWLTNAKTETIQAQGREWQVTISPVESTTDNAFRQITISVAPVADGVVKNSIVTVDGVLLKPTTKQ
ncbi:general secretion pathway protein I [Moraxella macacae 0408225]|uniref:Type II secretion system protein I n=1 Tax=Moraxella macacae 0408225 TaxID=1230338 RepID=L2F6X5_9GAMM|nr:type II secretion system minor pseudopilin GspI [Moraxella macacae]ELA08640.1 general secretion pathway protein I [Moraxella macacae 0408225]